MATKEKLRRAKTERIIADSPTSRAGMGKKRATNRKTAKTPREQFAARLRQLAGDRPASDLATAWGCTVDAALKYLRGDRVPKLDEWPTIAAGVGLDNWQELLPPVE